MANKEFKIELTNEKIKPLLDKLKLWCEKGQLEPRNYEVLSNMITKCENYDDAISILEIATQSRKTGLFYRHQFEKVPTNKIHFLEEDTKMSFGKKGTVNKLIIGDNYLALKNLLVTYRGKIDVIYIDPPYGCNDMGEFAEVNYENNITRDNLLSQLSPRIELAHELLSDNGVIFVSIDDKNQAYVKCLLDKYFKESNFISNVYWRSRGSQNYVDPWISNVGEYILIYAKEKNRLSEFNRDKSSPTDYKNPDNDPLGPWTSSGIIRDDGRRKYTVISPKGVKFTKAWLYTEENFNALNAEGRIWWGKNGDSIPRRKSYLKEWSGNPFISAIIQKGLTTEKGTETLKKIFGDSPFPYPKPVELIQLLINLIRKDDAIILDFYAGSGTTGHAVLALNDQVSGKRSFILCTNEDKGNNGQYPNGIGSDVTFERLKRVMTGKASDGSKFKWAEENEPYGQTLKVYRIAEVENTNKDVFKLIDPKNYDYPCSTEKKKIEWICKNFEETQKILKEKK